MYHVIVNPKSRSGRGLEIWIKVKKRLLLERLEFQECVTRYRGHARKAAEAWTKEAWNPEDVLVIIGGDGTVNEVLNGIWNLSEVTVGYLPTGSGNDFARGMGITADWEQGLERLIHPKKIRRVNIGINYLKGHKRRFAISSGMGFDAGICHEALSSGIKNALNKVHLGKLTYVCIALKELAAFTPQTMMIRLENGERLKFEEAYFAVAMNLPYEGGGCKFVPNACPNDGLLDVMVVSKIPKWKVLLILPFAVKGRHTRFKEVHMVRCRSISIETGRRLPVHLDGESGGYQKKMELSLERENLKIITE